MSESTTLLRLRGLPWSVTKSEIVDFFDPIPLKNGEGGVEICMGYNGRPSGEALVTIECEDDMDEAEKKHKKHIGSRYVEVFPVRGDQQDSYRGGGGRSSRGNVDDCIMRLRGLPYRCSKEEILDFFDGLQIVSNGIVLPRDHQGRPTGDAYVEFANRETAEKSLDRNKEKIGHRYVEIFKSTEMEMNSCESGEDSGSRGGFQGYGRSNPYDSRDRHGGSSSRSSYSSGRPRYDDYQGNGGSSGGSGGYSSGWGGSRRSSDRRSEDRRSDRRSRERGDNCVHMRGLPFRASEDDVADFFSPVVPTHVSFTTDQSGRASGEADVDFATHEDAVRAMGKDKQNMMHRYIELFLNSSGDGRRN